MPIWRPHLQSQQSSTQESEAVGWNVQGQPQLQNAVHSVRLLLHTTPPHTTTKKRKENPHKKASAMKPSYTCPKMILSLSQNKL